VLSNGEKFRVTMARVIAEQGEISVVDEFTSVVDRTVAKIGSHAISKSIRRMGKKFIAVTCHYDIIDWLNPDWIYSPADNNFQWRFLQQRPGICLEIYKTNYKTWELFKKYHYLSANISKSSQCFVAVHNDIPVCFFSYLHFVNNRLKKTKRGHRVVCLPDYQGAGIGMWLEEYIASCLRSVGYDYIGASAHPIRTAYCMKSKNWKAITPTRITTNRSKRGDKKKVKHLNRLTTTFRYIGSSEKVDIAERIINGNS